MKVLVDSNYFFTGTYSDDNSIGGFEATEGYFKIETTSIPKETDYIKSLAYKWDTVNLVWVYDSDKYAANASVSTNDISTETLQSSISYLAMMTGVDLNV